MVAILSNAIGKPIECVAIAESVARQNMLKAGMPAVMVEAALQGITFRPGQDHRALPTAEQVVGPKALTWREWTRENASVFT